MIVIILTYMGNQGIEVTTQKKLLGHVQAKTFSKSEKRNQKKNQKTKLPT